MRIGLLGGSFNPIHNGHLVLAETALKQLHLDKVIFIPAHIPPHKHPAELVDAEKRYAMTELAVRERRGFEVSRYEIDKRQTSYSIDTIEHFRSSYPKDTELFFIIGANFLDGLNKWRDIDRVLKLCRFAIANRPGFSSDFKYPKAEKIDMSPVEVSSTEIRKKIREGKSLSGLLPQAVEDYIKSKGFYK